MKNFLIAIALLCSITTFSQGKLKSAKDSFQLPDSAKNIVLKDENYSSSGNNESSVSVFEEAILPLVLGAVYYATVGLVYSVAVESPFEADAAMANSKIEPYPFYYGNKGDYTYLAKNPQLWRLEVSDSYFNETDRLQANDLRLKVRYRNRLALSSAYIHFWEKPVKEKPERLDFFMATLDYYRIRTPHFAMYWGVGAGYIGNEIKEAGFAMNIGSEFYFRPFSIDVSYKFSAIADNYLGLFEVGPKYHLKQYFGHLKYQNYTLGSEKASGFSIGLGLYF